jgi:cytidylate kinase
MQPIIIAIDGYSSCGKSTLAKALAKRLGYAYMDTGAMYRAVTLYGLRNNLNFHSMNDEEINHHIDQILITFKADPENGDSITFLNGEDVEQEIRGAAVSNAVSSVAQIKAIRKRMVELQQQAGRFKGLVMDGRDIGTKVFPNAELKLFMTAKAEIRAERRYKELKAKGVEVELEEIMQNLEKRDHDDTHREENPLVKAKDAIELDNSYLDQEEQLNFVLRLIDEKLN